MGRRPRHCRLVWPVKGTFRHRSDFQTWARPHLPFRGQETFLPNAWPSPSSASEAPATRLAKLSLAFLPQPVAHRLRGQLLG